MRNLKRAIVATAIGLAVAVSGVLVQSPQRTQEPPTTSTTPPPPTYLSRVELMLRLTNRARVAQGAPRLKLDSYANYRAHRHSSLMLARGELFHSTSYPWSYWGENIGVGASVRELFRAFMHSPDHRANILNPHYRLTGIGFARGDGRLWETQVFYRQEAT